MIFMAVINLTSREKEILANQYDENKRTFERVLARDLRAFFAGVGDDVFASFAGTGFPPDFSTYLQELAALLKKNYRKTGAFFSSHIQRLLRELQPKNEAQEAVVQEVQEERSKLEALLLLLLIPFYDRQSKQQARFILNTTQKIVRDEQLKVLTDIALSDETLTNAQIARKISKATNERNKKRVPNISEDQVGDIAQHTKQVEADEVAKSASAAGIAVEPMKTWITVGDSVVRPAHRGANKQKRGLNELYVVGGELLKYPKDSSHGASLSNTINCRCDSVTTI